MHVLIAAAVLVGLVAFAFGEQTARNVVRAGLMVVAILTLAGLTYIVVDIVRDLSSTYDANLVR